MKVHPAFRPWVWALGWFMITWTCIYFITLAYWPHVNGVPFVEDMGAESLESVGTVRVVALGDSLLAQSLPKSSEFDSLLPDDVDWLMIAIGGKDWREFRPALPDVARLRPRILLVQDQILLFRGWRAWLRFLPVKARMSLSLVVRRVLGVGGKPAAPGSFVANGMTLEQRIDRLSALYAQNFPLDRAAIEFIAGLKEIAPKVIVMNIPRASAFIAGRLETEWQESLKWELQQLGVDYLTVGEPLPDDYYYDWAHANEKGRAVRLDQFLGLVAELRQ